MLPASAKAKKTVILSGEGRTMVQFDDPQFGRRAVKLLPADYYAGADDVAIVTVLGSCIAACIRDPIMRIGGMNHFMLPESSGADGSDARYGSYLMEMLINALLKRGAARNRLEAKIFGGGQVMQSFTNTPVGLRNSEFVLNYLKAEKIPVVAQDLLGIHPRKVCFFPDSGGCLVKRLPHAHDSEVAAEERAYRAKLLQSSSSSGDVELFG
jgi:chemotaxis protein CheD